MTTTAALDPKDQDREALCKGKRVVICDDHPSTRLGFRDICARLGCEVVAEATTGEEALELLEVCRPDLLLLDQYLPGALDGPAVHREVRRRHLVPKVLVITSFCDSASFFDWIHQPDGPDGVLDKATGVYELKTAIIQMLTGERKYIPDSIWYREHGNNHNPLSKLAPHELRVLRDVAQGFKLVEIAQRQSLKASTIRSYMNAIYYKLELTSNTLQGAAAMYNKWVNAGPLPPGGGSE